MSQITLNTDFTKNASLQIGDVIYYEDGGTIKRIGTVDVIDTESITCTIDGDATGLTPTSFIFFGKDNQINTSGIVGYYAEIQFKNESTSEAELFAVNSEVFISSN